MLMSAFMNNVGALALIASCYIAQCGPRAPTCVTVADTALVCINAWRAHNFDRYATQSRGFWFSAVTMSANRLLCSILQRWDLPSLLSGYCISRLSDGGCCQGTKQVTLEHRSNKRLPDSLLKFAYLQRLRSMASKFVKSKTFATMR